jgi:hypothetical protein
MDAAIPQENLGKLYRRGASRQSLFQLADFVCIERAAGLAAASFNQAAVAGAS